jgi:Flp pilus assembly protein TadD
MSDLISKYEAKVAEKPENELFRFSLAKALIDAGRHAEAELHLQWAFEKKPDWMVVVMLLAQCALQRGDKPAARAWYEKALTLALDQKHEAPEAEIRAALSHLD